MDRKTGIGWVSLIGYLARFGSVPSDERALASILDVSVQFLETRAWPLIADRLLSSEDGKRYFCPDVPAPRSRDRAQAPQKPAPSARHQKAANIRHHGNPNGHSHASGDASADASLHATHMQPDASLHVIPMHDASETHAKTAAFASPVASSDASDASPRSRAPSPPSEDSSVSESHQNHRESFGERGDARADTRASEHASGDATDMHPTHATRMQPDASVHASKHRSGRSRAPAATVPIAPDWTPSEASGLEARKRGYEPVDMAVMFRDHYIGNGQTRADWDAEFRNWVRRQVGFDAERRQGHMTMGVAGGAKDPVAKPAAFEAFDPATEFGPVIAGQWLRVQRRLRDHIGSSDYRVWLSGMTLSAIDGDTVTICLPNSYLRDRARGNYTSWLTAAWRQERPEISEVTAVVPAREQRTAEG
jgi:hypothetical protein